MPRPLDTDIAPFYRNYVASTQSENPTDALKNGYKTFKQSIERVNNQNAAYRYADGKWSLKEILQHLTDTERVFTFRALNIARGILQLEPFDQDVFVSRSNADYRVWEQLTAEFDALHMATLQLFDSFDTSMLEKKGFVDGNPMTVNGIGFIIGGHQIHHAKVIKEKYIPNI